METLKKKWRDLPLRRFLILTVCLSFVIAALVSALIISGCMAFRHWLLPDSNAVYLTIEQTLSNGDVISSTYLLDMGDNLSALPFAEIGRNDAPEMEDIQQKRYSIKKIEIGVDSLIRCLQKESLPIRSAV